MSHTDHTKARGTLLGLLLVLVTAASPLVAQSSSAQTAPPAAGVWVAIADDFPDIDARAMVVRERGRDIVVLRATEATTDALAMSLMVLRRLRADDPRPEQGQIVPITGFVVTRPPRSFELGRLQDALERLARAEPTSLGTLGQGRWVVLRGAG